MAVHSRSVVAVGAADWNWLVVHVAWSVHSRSVVAVGASDWNWLPVHTVSA